MIKGTIQQEDITLVNISTANIATPKYVKQILKDIKGEINRNTVIFWDFNNSMTSMDRSSRQKINKETAAINDTLDQMELTDVYIEILIPKKQNTHSFQVHMEHFQR